MMSKVVSVAKVVFKTALLFGAIVWGHAVIDMVLNHSAFALNFMDNFGWNAALTAVGATEFIMKEMKLDTGNQFKHLG